MTNRPLALILSSFAAMFLMAANDIILGGPHVGDGTALSFNSQITGVMRIPGKKDLLRAG